MGAWRGCDLNAGNGSSAVEAGTEQQEDAESSGGVFRLEGDGVCR